MCYNARNDKIRDNITPMRRDWEAQRNALAIRRFNDAFSLYPQAWRRRMAVRAAFANATLIRPAVMFGPDDAFLTTITKLLSRFPIYPMFGRGLTKLQPAYVEDVAEAIVRMLQRTDMDGDVRFTARCDRKSKHQSGRAFR